MELGQRTHTHTNKLFETIIGRVRFDSNAFGSVRLDSIRIGSSRFNLAIGLGARNHGASFFGLDSNEHCFLLLLCCCAHLFALLAIVLFSQTNNNNTHTYCVLIAMLSEYDERKQQRQQRVARRRVCHMMHNGRPEELLCVSVCVCSVSAEHSLTWCQKLRFATRQEVDDEAHRWRLELAHKCAQQTNKQTKGIANLLLVCVLRHCDD